MTIISDNIQLLYTVRNTKRNELGSKKTISVAEKLPYFTIESLKSMEKDKNYLKIFLSRYSKKGKIIRLKRGLYVSKDFIDEAHTRGIFSSYLEFLANIIYFPSYFSLEYILYKHNILTEVPVNFTLITANKTAKFTNKVGNFFYHKIKARLFTGFKILEKDGFFTYEATKAKALFDSLYLRKNLLVDKRNVEELRLNVENLNKKDKEELEKYVELESSKKMKGIFGWLFEI